MVDEVCQSCGGACVSVTEPGQSPVAFRCEACGLETSMEVQPIPPWAEDALREPEEESHRPAPNLFPSPVSVGREGDGSVVVPIPWFTLTALLVVGVLVWIFAC